MTTTVCPTAPKTGDRSPLPAPPQGRTEPHNAPVLDAAARATREWVASLARARSRTGTSRAAHPTHPASDQQRKRSGLNARRTPRALRPASPSSQAVDVPHAALLAVRPCVERSSTWWRSSMFAAGEKYNPAGGSRVAAGELRRRWSALHSVVRRRWCAGEVGRGVVEGGPSRRLTAMAAAATPTYRPQPSPMINPETGCVIDARIPEKVSDTGHGIGLSAFLAVSVAARAV
jgi:hypothetical protein